MVVSAGVSAAVAVAGLWVAGAIFVLAKSSL
jgi:hypothetical protein